MKRRSRPPAVRHTPAPSSAVYPSTLKQSQSRATALANGTREFRKLDDDADDPVQDNNTRATDTTASYSDDLLNAFKRKTQELCDETREQYEQKIERQEAQHERKVQSLQRQLREVVGSCVSLAEHEQILAMTAKEQQRQLEEIGRRHQSEVRELEQRCEQKWEARETAVKEQREQDKSALLQRIEQLELQKSEAAAGAKERELSELRWSEKLEAAGRAKEVVEKRVEDGKKRLGDACRIIIALKTRVRHHARDLESQREKTIETRDEVMRCKLAYAELKGDISSLDKELAHAQRTVADEKVNTCKLQSEVVDLREQVQRQQCTEVELTAKGTLSAEHHATERKQLHKEVETLQKALQQETQTAKDACARMDKTQLQHQTLVQNLRTRLELQKTTEVSLKRQTQRLKQRVEQLRAVVEKLHAENKQLDEQLHHRDVSTEAWAKKLFGRQ
ncbi:hypothetical protein PRIC1_006921 [Phytophthora ramorum]